MPFPLVLLRVKRWGTSLGVVLPRLLRDEMGLAINDVIAVRIHKPYATMAVWRASDIIKLGTVDVNTLPPLNPRELTNG